MGKFIDLTGKKFNRLTVIKRVENYGNSKWLCQCDCGEYTETYGRDLRNNHSKSCGCYKKEKTIKKFTTHGLGKTRSYRIWSLMKDRCTNKNSKSYKYYGGRGIKVCEEWLNFDGFYNDMGECPINLSLDRKNNNGNYCKSNCEWSTKKEQANNKRNNNCIYYNGKTQTIAQWAEEYSLDYQVLWDRVIRYKIPISEALVKRNDLVTLTFNGETKTMKDWAIFTGIHYNNLRARILKGWTVERALTQKVIPKVTN